MMKSVLALLSIATCAATQRVLRRVGERLHVRRPRAVPEDEGGGVLTSLHFTQPPRLTSQPRPRDQHRLPARHVIQRNLNPRFLS